MDEFTIHVLETTKEIDALVKLVPVGADPHVMTSTPSPPSADLALPTRAVGISVVKPRAAIVRVKPTLAIFVTAITLACSSAKDDGVAKSAAPTPVPAAAPPAAVIAPPFELGACGATEETFEGSLRVEGEIDGQAFGAACVAGAIETERLGTTAIGLAYNVTCKSADATERLSFWVKGFTQGAAFGTKDKWELLPNISLQADSPAGQLKRHSFGPQPEHVERLGSVVWILEGGEVGMTAPFPEHRLKGCVEAKFQAFDVLKAGTLKVLFDLKFR